MVINNKVNSKQNVKSKKYNFFLSFALKFGLCSIVFEWPTSRLNASNYIQLQNLDLPIIKISKRIYMDLLKMLEIELVRMQSKNKQSF